MDEYSTSAEFSGAGESGSDSSTTALAERSPVVGQAPDASPVERRAETASRKPSIAALGGSFASLMFHLWLLAMLASLTMDRNDPLPAMPIDAVIDPED